jgi:hypothetical protein
VATLNVHQSKSGDHHRLGFHPDCSTYRRDRLFGVFAPEPVLSHRVRVFLVTGVLALSAGAATTSVASEPDSHQEGPSVPEQGGSPAPDDSADESPDQSNQGDAGGDTDTALPFEVAPVVSPPDDDGSADAPEGGPDEPAPLEAQPTPDTDGELGLTEPNAPDTINADDVPAPPTEANPPVAPAPPAQPPPAASTPPQAPDQASLPAPEDNGDGAARVDGKAPAKDRTDHQRRSHPPPTPPAPAPPAVESPPLGVATPTERVRSVEASAPPQGIARFHVVQPGESLWAIATDLLRAEASAGATALEVRRLWGLNDERIGTGDPDLLPVGVKLRLR